MSKKNGEKYLPLYWVEMFLKQFKGIYGTSIPFEDLRIHCEHQYSKEVKLNNLEKYPQLSERLALLTLSGNAKFAHEHTRDLDGISMAMMWAKNKQVYAFDADFIDELLNTETLTFSENAWDYLPYDYIYIDLSANKRVCNSIMGKGMFLRVEKCSNPQSGDSVYVCHICKLTEDYFFTDVFSFENKDNEIAVSDIFADNEVPIWETNDNGKFSTERKETFNGIMYKTLIPQILSYLSSVEPDVSENETTKKTYRKPSENSVPKNKFSEVRKWDIGVRYGTAFRKWKKQKSDQTVPIASGGGTKKRPHSRRAHWSHYWYGHGEDKVRRPKWVAAYFVNTEDGEDTTTIIHKVNDTEK